MTDKIDEVEQAMEYTYNALDTIDFLPFIKKHRGGTLINLRLELEEKYDGTEFTNNPAMEGYLFNWLTDEEFMEYLEKRYPKDFRCREVSTFYIC